METCGPEKLKICWQRRNCYWTALSQGLIRGHQTGGAKARTWTADKSHRSASPTTDKYDRSEIGGNHRRNRYRYGEGTIPRGKILNDARQQHIQQPPANLLAASQALAGRQMNLRDILTAMGAASQVREHRFPTEHARARRNGLALKRDRHQGRETSKLA